MKKEVKPKLGSDSSDKKKLLITSSEFYDLPDDIKSLYKRQWQEWKSGWVDCKDKNYIVKGHDRIIYKSIDSVSAKIAPTVSQSAVNHIAINDVKARDLCMSLGYVKWDKFNNVVLKAINLIKNGISNGKIELISKNVGIGSNAKRNIVDYSLDNDAVFLIKRLVSSKKLIQIDEISNEAKILFLLKKYCNYKGIDFVFQYRTGKYVFDAKVGNSTLIEFDEPHHVYSKIKDDLKEQYAKNLFFTVRRFDVYSDIIDIIKSLDI